MRNIVKETGRGKFKNQVDVEYLFVELETRFENGCFSEKKRNSLRRGNNWAISLFIFFQVFIISLFSTPPPARAESSRHIVCSISTNTFKNLLFNIQIRKNGVIAGPMEKVSTCEELLQRVEESECSVDPLSLHEIENIKKQQTRQAKVQHMFGQSGASLRDLISCEELLKKALESEKSRELPTHQENASEEEIRQDNVAAPAI